MRHFVVNEFITLKLENGKTMIYVLNEPFIICKSLFVEIPVKQVSELNGIESVDEAAERLDIKQGGFEYHIPPETEFWGHCSNMQVWAEYNYDTRLLHSSMAFPLLAKLFRVGDPVAKSVFKEEIAKRLGSGCQSVISFLYEEDFVYSYLSEEEIFHSILVPEEAEIMIELQSQLNTALVQRWKFSEPDTFIVKDKHICSINLSYSELEEVPELILNLKNLERLELYHNKISYLPDSFVELKNLTYLDLSFNKFTEFPLILKDIKTLKHVNLIGNDLLVSLKEEDLSNFKDAFIELIVPEQKLYRIFKRISEILEGLGHIKVRHLAEMLGLKSEETLNRLFIFHKKEMERSGLKLKINQRIISLDKRI